MYLMPLVGHLSAGTAPLVDTPPVEKGDPHSRDLLFQEKIHALFLKNHEC